ncbi:MAG: 50S ribosomal protein L24 [Patescibacteria group bacterium]
MKIRTGDTITILTGKDKGKTGKVMQVFPELEKVVIEGLNIAVKNVRSRTAGQGGQQVKFPAPLAASKVMLVCPKCGQATRVGYQLPVKNADGTKTKKMRRCLKCRQTIE